MRIVCIHLTILLNLFIFAGLYGQEIPLVYKVENTGADWPAPYMLSIDDLPAIEALPDPFEWADCRGRISNFSDWQYRRNEPINRLYIDLEYIGAYSAWSWGVSCLIDGLELVSQDLNIDLEHLAVTGCSFAGKMTLFAGAFDERIALTIAQESGGKRKVRTKYSAIMSTTASCPLNSRSSDSADTPCG